MSEPIRNKQRRGKPWTVAAVLGAALLIGLTVVAAASAGPTGIRIVRAPGKIVPIPDSIPHQPGAMIDRRLISNLRYLSAHFAIYINEGYAGPMPGHPRQTVGCPRCHVADSDHKNGLAVDIGPRHWSAQLRHALEGGIAPRQVGRAAAEPPASTLSLGWLQRRRQPRVRQPSASLLEPCRGEALQGRLLGRDLQGRSVKSGRERRHRGAERRHQRGAHPSRAAAGDRWDRPRRLIVRPAKVQVPAPGVEKR